jgi:hypothetical protein
MKLFLLLIILFQAVFYYMHIKSDEYEEADKVFNHDKTYSTVYGKLTTETFYGPPGYGEDPENDEKVNQYILYLEEDPLGKMAKMQLVYLGDEDLSKFKNNQVKVKGTFFSSHTGYHNTPILIESKNIELVQ